MSSHIAPASLSIAPVNAGRGLPCIALTTVATTTTTTTITTGSGWVSVRE